MTGTDPETEAPTRPLLRLSEGLLLAAVPVAGIALALAFEGGYASRFGVPVWIVELDTAQVVIASALVASSAMLVINLLALVPVKPWSTLAFLLLRSIPMLWIVLYTIRVTEWSWGLHLIFPLSVVVLMGPIAVWIVLDDLILPIWRRTGDTIWDRWEAELSLIREQPVVAHSVAHQLWRRTGSNIPLSVGIAALAALGVWTLGERRAERQVDFLYDASIACLVVRRYHDHFLCVEADTSAPAVHPHFRLLPVGDVDRRLSRVKLYGLRTVADSTERVKLFRRLP